MSPLAAYLMNIIQTGSSGWPVSLSILRSISRKISSCCQRRCAASLTRRIAPP